VLVNRVLRKIFWTKKVEVIGEWRRLRDEELHDLYPPNIIREMKRRRIKWARHGPWARVRENRGA